MRLYVGNKNYSSWSLRPWIAMTEKQVQFEEVLVPFDMKAGNPQFAEFSPTNRVPVLHDGDLVIPESLAILEYMADKFPDKEFWPSDIADRARARAMSHEMHGGFGALRNECPMNLRRKPSRLNVSDAVHKDVDRIIRIWEEALDASGGPFLFGAFSNADAMFAPVVNRLEIYCLSDHETVRPYTKAVKGTDGWRKWEGAGIAEPWVVEEDEV